MNAISQAKIDIAALPSLTDIVHRQTPGLFAPSDHPAVTGNVRQGRWEEALLAPVNDILSRPAKAIRARLVDAGFALVRPGESAPEAATALVEILHAGSLIIDDIEDDSKVRRGGKTIHRVHGMPKALNAGNWMYFLAARQIEELHLSTETTLRLYRLVNRTLLDCHRGQALDLSLHVGEVSQSEVPTLVAETSLLKTGALTALACALGAVVAGGSDEQVAAMEKFGRELGLALQQLDDLGNLTAKGPASKRYEDLRNGRLTWPWAWAAELLDPLAYKNLEFAARSLTVTGLGARPSARSLASALARVAGPHRRQFIVHRLRGMLKDLATVFPAGQGEVSQLREQIHTLEESYV
jgi:geranylgeranyl pyrophosphate synthase